MCIGFRYTETEAFILPAIGAWRKLWHACWKLKESGIGRQLDRYLLFLKDSANALGGLFRVRRCGIRPG